MPTCLQVDGAREDLDSYKKKVYFWIESEGKIGTIH